MRNEAPLINIFLKSTNEINLTTGLHYFLTKVVSKTDIAGSRQDRDTVRWGCKAAGDALKDEASSWALYEDERDL